MRRSSNGPQAKLIAQPWINLFTQAHWQHSQSNINNEFFKLVEALI